MLVLCYHAVEDTWDWRFNVPPRALERQVAALLRHGYYPVTFGDAVAAEAGARVLSVTFDDAFRSVVAARGVLDRLGVPATVFVPTAYAGKTLPHVDRPALSWGELAELVATGWEVGSHTRTHRRLTELGDAELAEELEGSRRECEQRLDAPCRSLAYPYGDVDDRVVAAARAAGYGCAAAYPPRHTRGDRFRVARVAVTSRDGPWRFRLKSSPLVRRLRAQ